MYLKKSIGYKGKLYLSFVQGYRIDGKVKHKTIEKLGYYDDLKKIYNDPISHFDAIAKERSNIVAEELSIDINQRLSSNTSNRKNLGYAVPKYVYNVLGINTFLLISRNILMPGTTLTAYSAF